MLRPWPAEDGALVRLRLVGGQVSPTSLTRLLEVATTYGDGTVHLTKRANLQLRALPADGGCLASEVVTAIEATGLLPSPTHELVRNIMVSPLSGLLTEDLRGSQSPGDCNPRNNGRADLRPLARALDEALCADPTYAGLSARFLFVLDDGRGDVVGRNCDLGWVALDADTVQLRIGEAWGEVVPLERAVPELLALAGAFVAARGTGPTSPWHVTELDRPLTETRDRDPRTRVSTDPPAYGRLAEGVEHVAVADGLLTPGLLERLVTGRPDHLVVTPWRSVIVCD